MSTKAKPAASGGIERRLTSGGRRRYRWTYHGGKVGKKNGPWCDSLAEAKSGRAKFLGELQAGMVGPSSSLTLRGAWEAFHAEASQGAARSKSGRPFKASTLRGYERGWKKIDPELGAHRLTDIRRADVQGMVDRWVAKGWSPSTIRNSLDPLRVLYRRALVRDLVVANPTLNLELPADSDENPMRFASRDEAKRLLAALPNGERALWAAAMYAGLRRGELRALRWTDVDLAGRMIHVSRNWDDKEGETTPKTKGSNRKVPIVPELAALLRSHARETGRSGDDLVFGRTATEPFIPTTVRDRAITAWEAANEKKDALGRSLNDDEGLDPITLHQCRHTFASLMIAAGCNAKALSVVMGHSSITITFDRYGKLMPGGEAEVGQMLAEYLQPSAAAA